MSEQHHEVAAEETSPHPAKTVNSILVEIAAALEQADKLVNHEDVSELTAPLRDALAKVPPSDLNEMVTHINAMYLACERMAITRIAFRADVEGKRLVAIVGIQFGIREIELFAPFDKAGYTNMLKEFSGSLDLLTTNKLILPEGIA